MNFDPPRQWEPGADDGDQDGGLHNKLERAMDTAGRNPAKHRAMWRTLSKSQLHVLMPYHPEMEGRHELREGQALPIMHVTDEEGPFVPIFASHDRAVAAARALEKRCCIASLPCEAVFKTLVSQHVRIVINPHEGPRLSMQPDTVKAFVQGELTQAGSGIAVPEKVALAPVHLDDLPEELISHLRDFGQQHSSVIGIYVFNAVDEETHKPIKSDIRILLWMRAKADQLYQDLAPTLATLLPDGSRGGVALLDGSNPEAIDYVQQFKPVWPTF
jgi:hypothetical protein